MLNVGDKAPDFTLKDQHNTSHSLSDYAGKWVLIYFYPKDDTPGCTTEACAIRDNFHDFKSLNCVVLGISTDPVKSHDRFAKKHELPFTLLADEEKRVVHDYAVWGKKKFMGREYMGTHRISYLIDPSGHIVRVYDKVKPAVHAKEVLRDLQVMKQI